MRAIVITYLIFWVISRMAGKKNKQEQKTEVSTKKVQPKPHAPSSLEHWLETEDLAKARKKHEKKAAKKKAAKKQKPAAPMTLREELERSRQGKTNFDMKAERLRDRAEDMKVEHLSDQPRDFMKPEKLRDEHRIEYAPIAQDEAAAKDAYAKKEKKAHPRVSLARKAILYREIIDEPVSMRESRMF